MNKILRRKTNIFFLITISLLFCIIGIMAYFGPQDEKGMQRFLGPWIFGFGLICLGFVWWSLKNKIIYFFISCLALILGLTLFVNSIVEQLYDGMSTWFTIQFFVSSALSIVHGGASIDEVTNYFSKRKNK